MKRDEVQLTSAWILFVAEVRRLLAMDPAHMEAEALDRLEALSDPLIHLVGYRESMEHWSAAAPDLGADDARRGAGRMGAEERGRLRERIVAGVQAQRLRVALIEGMPSVCTMGDARRVGSELLAEAQSAHRAVFVPELAIAAGAGHDLWETDCDTLIQLSAAIPQGQYLALKVAGDSMEPLLHSGDVVLVRLGSEVAVGRVVVARDPDHGYVVKEIGQVTVDAIELHSLNASFAPVLVPHSPSTVLGTVLLRWCPHASAKPMKRSPRTMS